MWLKDTYPTANQTTDWTVCQLSHWLLNLFLSSTSCTLIKGGLHQYYISKSFEEYYCKCVKSCIKFSVSPEIHCLKWCHWVCGPLQVTPHLCWCQAAWGCISYYLQNTRESPTPGGSSCIVSNGARFLARKDKCVKKKYKISGSAATVLYCTFSTQAVAKREFFDCGCSLNKET